MEATLVAAVARGHGIATAAELRALGVSSRLLSAWLRRGVVVQVRRGAYTTRELWESWDIYRARPLARVRAVSRVLQINAVFSHDSSALLQEVPLLRPQDAAVHVTQQHLRGSRTKSGVRHHGAAYAPGQVIDVGGLPTLDRARTAVDLAREHGYRAGLVAADGAMQLGVSRSELAAAAAPLAGWPHSLTVNEVVAAADPGAESVGESLMRELVAELGLGPIETQFPVRIASGVVWIDMRVGCHLFEFDGKVKLLSPDEGGVARSAAAQVLWEERKRQHLVCAEGLGMSRLSYDDFWGVARDRAKARVEAEFAVTSERFGTTPAPHLLELAAKMRGRRYQVLA
jgi:hypothetical protein